MHGRDGRHEKAQGSTRLFNFTNLYKARGTSKTKAARVQLHGVCACHVLCMHAHTVCTHAIHYILCIKDTIRRWLRRQPTHETHRQRVRPGLTQKNKEAQKQFAKLVLANWNLPRGKILWMQCDEKWFWGFTPRSNAKIAPFVLHVLCALIANRPPPLPPLPSLYFLSGLPRRWPLRQKPRCPPQKSPG
jgi:hypothetical protein